jgi:hypothetical protein
MPLFARSAGFSDRSLPFLVRCAALSVLFAPVVAGAAWVLVRCALSVRASAPRARGCPTISCPFVDFDAPSVPARSLSASDAHRRGSFTTRSVRFGGATERFDDPRAASRRRFEPAIAEPAWIDGGSPSVLRSAIR